MLAGEKITVRYQDKTAVSGLDFELKEGQWLMLVGPNGAGKSTLLKAVARSVPFTGRVTWRGQDIARLSGRALARRIGVLAQSHAVTSDFTVEEVVALGRYAHRKGLLSGGDPEGPGAIARALAFTGLEPLRRARLSALSGGEVQRAYLAQVFAQEPEALLLDEPANHLDLQYQQQLFGLIRDWLRMPGRAALSVVHDLTLARRYGTHALLMDRGRCAARGPIDGVLTPDRLAAVYGMDVYAWMWEGYRLWNPKK